MLHAYRLGMLNLVPLPDWRALWRALISGGGAPSDWARTWQQDANDRVGCLSRSAWSLALIAQWRCDRANQSRAVCVWVPDYYCNSSLEPLRRLGVQLLFYPITESLEPDYVQCRALALNAPPDLFVHVHYFGRPVPASRSREFCRRHGAWLIEDAAHVLVPVDKVGEEGDFILYSPHKLLALPSGAVLVARPDGASGLGGIVLTGFGPPSLWPSQLASLASQLVLNRSLRLDDLVWTAKRLLQKLGIQRKAATLAFHEDGTPMPGRFPAPALSGYAMRLLAQAVPTLSSVTQWRQRNQMLLDFLVVRNGGESLQSVMPSLLGDWTPYTAIYEAPACAEAAYLALRRSGLPATSWPDLPPEVMANTQQHPVALRLRKQRLYLPVHQSLRPSMLVRCKPVAAVASSREDAVIEWDICDAPQWARWMQQAVPSNLLQSWAYGAAKSEAEGWRVRRALIKDAVGVVACAQVLSKRFAGLLTVSRINRGPLFLRPVTPEVRLGVLRALHRSLGCWCKGHVLSWAPELMLDGQNLGALVQLGVRQISPHAWESSLIDLQQDEDRLRAQLAGRWRNMLVAAQRLGAGIETLDDEASFEALLKRCQEMMQARQQNFPADTYRALRRQMPAAQMRGLLLAIRSEGDMVAAVWIVPHGSTATYLLGWSDARGRKIHAHHLLLWEAMLRMKQLGVAFFDAGGVDSEGTQGIAAFKLGLGGTRYRLVGEGWCL